MSTSVSVFFYDPVFINHSVPFQSHLSVGGVGLLSAKGLSFFSQLEQLTDTRTPSTRLVDWAPTSTDSPSLLLDAQFYSQFQLDLTNAIQSDRDALFTILDAIFYHHGTTSLETYLTTNPSASLLYKPQSLQLSTTTVTGTYYTGSPVTPTPINCVSYAEFSIVIPQGTTSVQYDLTVYIDNATWIAHYPNSTVVAVAPPIDYNTLLNTPLATTTANLFSTASNVSQLNYASLYPQLDTAPASGYINYFVTVYDPDGSHTLAPFNILYRGAVPSQLQIRQAVLSSVLGSGIGTSAQWQTRIPELFVNSRYYLIPLWDNTFTLGNQSIYKGFVSTSRFLSIAQTILPATNNTVIAATTEVFEAAYNRIVLVSVEDITDPSKFTALSSVFPSYQAYSSTDTNFAYMTTATQNFATALNKVLAVASGNTVDPTMYITTDRGLQYISFTQNQIEFCVITQTGYIAMLSATS